MLALSTVWNAGRRETGLEVIKEIQGTGISCVELNFFLDSKMVEEILDYCRTHGLSIVSLHNFCPVPDGLERLKTLPDHFSLAALDETERLLAVHHTRNTLLTARRCGASCVVLHCGRAEIKDRTRHLIRLAQEGKKETQEYREDFAAFVEERKNKSRGHVPQLIKSLKTLSDTAEEYRLNLGIENRFYYREIPFLDEFGEIFDALKGRPVGLWLDVGHNFILEQLGFLVHGKLLKDYGSRLIGIHLHNVNNLVDHQAAMTGQVNFNDFKPYVRPETIKVMELHGHVTQEEVKESAVYFREVFGD
jgi:sugar phosphate isomerase/epimerase